MARTWIVENTWKCSSCGASNQGRSLRCDGCGCRKPASARDIVDANASAVTAPDLLQQAGESVHWVCTFCLNRERDPEGRCTHCGAQKAGAEHSKSLSSRVSARYPSTTWRIYIAVAAAVLALGCLIWGVVWLATPREYDVPVADLSWKYTEKMRVRELRHSAEWGRPGPKGYYQDTPFNVSCQRKYYGQEDCDPYDCEPYQAEEACGNYECNCRTQCKDKGNGFSDCRQECERCTRYCTKTKYRTCYRSCPVYKQWCDFDYFEWPVRTTQETTGTTHQVSWPGLKPTSDFSRIERSEHYEVRFRCKDEMQTYRPQDLADFRRFSPGDYWRIRIGKVLGGVEPVRRSQVEKE